MAEIQKTSTSTFVTSDPHNFDYFSYILEIMLAKVPMDSEVIRIYRQIPKFPEREISSALQTFLDAGDIPKRGGGKWKAKVVIDKPMKSKSHSKRPPKKVKPVVVTEESEEDTLSDIHLNDEFFTDDATKTSEFPENNLELVSQPETVKLSTQIPTTNPIPTPIFTESTTTTPVSQPKPTSTTIPPTSEPIVTENEPVLNEYFTSEQPSSSVPPIPTTRLDSEPIPIYPSVHETSPSDFDAYFMVVDDPEVLEPYVATPTTVFYDENSEFVTSQEFDVMKKKFDTLITHVAFSETTTKIDRAVLDIQAISEKMDSVLKGVQDSVDNKLFSVETTVKTMEPYLQEEKESFSALHFALQKDNFDHHTSFLKSILALQRNYEGESKLMNTIAEKTHKIKTMRP
ncbi:unnamed protein product [Lactuca virosa]|uniref:FRIGIDA-like protein n=1 Tax=Lactuca virosa TaxID=75947 RepID=A0AAU9L8W8_9ASTR|nr:unnamed protein product [Lactuca virosa]